MDDITQSSNSPNSADDTYEPLRVPSYLVAANNHNIAAGDEDWIDTLKGAIGGIGGAAAGAAIGATYGSALGPIGTLGGAAIGGVGGAILGAKTVASNGKFAVASAVSGALSFYNTGVALNNWLGGSAEKVTPDDAMASMDSDLAQYYSENRMAADVTGFLAGSIFPMGISTKIYSYGTAMLNAAKAGKIGSNMSEATGLLMPLQNRLTQAAVSDLSDGSTFTLMNRNVLGAFAAGVGEEAIQGAIQTTAVMATMHASPILENEDASDIAWNVLSGALFQGAVGGVFKAATAYGTIKRGVMAAEQEAKPFSFVQELRQGSSPVHEILNYLDEKLNMPEVAEDAANRAYKLRLQQETFRKIDDRVRTKFREISGGDDAIGLGLSDIASTQNDIDTAASQLLGLTGASKVSTLTDTEKLLGRARRNIANGTATPDEYSLVQNTNVRYLKLHGEDIGDLLDVPPPTISLADGLKPGQSIDVKSGSVNAGSLKWNFTTKNTGWDVVGKDQKEVMARQIWAMDPNGAKLMPASEVSHTDLPLIDKAVRENIPINLRLQDGTTVGLGTQEARLDAQKSAKALMRDRLVKASADNEYVSDPVMVELKLKQMLGVPFKMGADDSGLAWTYKNSAENYQQIFLNQAEVASGRYTINRLAQAIKHEEGHNIWGILSDILPGISWDSMPDAIRQEMVMASKKVRPEFWKNPAHQAYLNSATELAADTFSYFSFRPNAMEKEAPNFAKMLGSYVRPVPKDLQDAALLKARKLSNDEIAQLLNVRRGFLEGTSVNETNPLHDLDALYGSAKEKTDMMREQGRWSSGNLIPTWTQPQYAKMVIDTTPVQDLNGNVLEGMAVIKQQQRLAQDAANRSVASVLGQDLYGQLQEFTDRDMVRTSKVGGSAGFFTSADGAYGSVESAFQQIGSAAHKIIKAFTDKSTSTLNSALYALKGDEAASTELSALFTKLRGTPETYYYDPVNQELVLRRIKLNEDAVAAGQKPKLGTILDPNAPETIAVENDKVHDILQAHISRNSDRVSDKNNLLAANGVQSKIDPQAVYAPPVNPRKYPYFAFVVDPTITETGHVHMIYAADEGTLDKMIQDVQRSTPYEVTNKNTQLKTLTKGEVERFHKAMGDFTRDDTISENYVRAELLRKGVSSNFIPPTDSEKIADELLDFHLDRDRDLARYAITTKYSKQFAELRSQGETFTNLATSKVGGSSLLRWAENQVSNPYADYVKTALDITNLNEIPRWTAVNRYIDSTFSKVWNTVSSLWQGSKSVENLDEINDTFKRFGLRTAYYDSATAAHANHVASDGAFTTFVSRANAVMATLLLRMDPLNAFNNTVGSTILTGAETKSLINLIKSNDKAAGELAGLSQIATPGTGDSILSPTKLYANAVRNFFGNPEARAFAVNNGFTTRHVMEVDRLIDEAAMTGKETDQELATKSKSLYGQFMKMGDLFEGLTGNRLAEQFNRFVSTDIMRQLTDVAVNNGLMDKKNALSYINTFVNRTQGNYLASQRPLMFQGPVGNAIGLFQTYQFNLAQQLLRHVAEGNAKDAALALGLQTAVYGMNGLPGFQQINAHIIGNASGNTNHRDLYDATYGVAGKDEANWLMYGMASNVTGFLHPDLKMNLYSRGDINPRQPTIIPTQLDQVPIVGAAAKLFTSIKDSLQKVANGAAAWPTFLQAIEHSGINRPLAGLAQTLEAFGNDKMQSYSTSTKGNVIAANDLFSLANLTRIAGGKPFDEAISLDAGYRLDAYKSRDNAMREQLGEAIKTTVMAGGMPDTDQINGFASRYAAFGGRQEGFNQFFINAMKKANTSQVNAIVDNLKTPYAQSMQRILGGYELNDFNR